MDRKQMMAFAVIGAALLCFALTAVTATPRIASSTPLYTIRMEQASDKMSFLPTQ